VASVATHAFGDRIELSALGREQRQDAVGLT
jgi:hypothetical protein